MKPIDQTKFGAPHGNCFGACICSIMEIPLDDFPDLSEVSVSVWGTYHKARDFCKARGYCLELTARDKHEFPPGYAIGAGRVARAKDREEGHACVFLDGKLVHNPNPCREGLIRVDWWFELVPLNEESNT